jgi:hypothetical protein
MISSIIFAQKMPRLLAELRVQLGLLSCWEKSWGRVLRIANLTARSTTQREGGRGLSYGG